MSEAKPQDGSTVKGYRTLSADDIAQMNELKEFSRDFCEKLDIERNHIHLEIEEGDTPDKDQCNEALYCPYQNAGSLYVGLSCCNAS